MNKEHILEELKRTAEENGGKALSSAKFEDETGISKGDWYGKYWTKYSDLVIEAGYEPNVFGQDALDENWLLEQLAIYTRELGHFPTKPELKMKSFNEEDFPSPTTFTNRFGTKPEMLKKVYKYCENNNSYSDVFHMIKPLVINAKEIIKENAESEEYGFVYLFWSQRMKLYKLGFSNHVGRRNYDLSTKLPEELKEIHKIKTDDPEGVEKYWHARFADKRIKDRRGDTEWFDLKKVDVGNFKRWKRIF